MALTNAEKQRRYRERRDKEPARLAEHRAKRREKYKQDLEVGKRKRIADMTPREQRKQRKEWKKTKAAHRKRAKNIMTTIDQTQTPPASPEDRHAPIADHHNTKRKKRHIAKCYRENEKLRGELATQRRLTQKYKMRLLRVQQKKSCKNDPDTPRTKANKLLRYWSTEKGKGTRKERRNLKEATRRTLVFQFALNEEIRLKYKELRQGKKSVLEMMRGKLMRKYKLVNRAVKEFRLAGGRNREKRGTLTSRLKDQVIAYYERDDISRLTSGMKQTITRKGLKKQKRILTDRIDKIHERYLIENTGVKISYTSFSRLRPFWVQAPRESDRNTCACKSHENMQYIVNALFKLKALTTDRLQDVVKAFTCNINDMSCMYGNCEKCSNVRLQSEHDIDTIEDVTYLQWQTKKESRVVKGETKEVSVTVKETVNDSLGFLIDKFYTDMNRFKIHTFNITNQLNHYRFVKENLQPNEVLLHIDFAENFQGKLASEIQSMHFGASKTQITLHTGVYFTHKKFQTFCTVSDCLDHNPSSIWAFLDPVIDDILTENKQLDTIHFFSDGPSTQYRQKGNFFLFSKEMKRRGLKATWNYHESGHGKGIPDGVGGALKRAANELVLIGKDIQNATAFVESIGKKETSIKLFQVDKKAVEDKSELLAAVSLKTVPGTFKLHQLKTCEAGEIYVRDVSCTCDGLHAGHQWKFARLTDSEDTKSKSKSHSLKTDINDKVNRMSKKGVRQEFVKESLKRLNVMKESLKEKTTKSVKRSDFFSKSLQEMEKCDTFKELEKICIKVSGKMRESGFEGVGMVTSTLSARSTVIDEDALSVFPSDLPLECQKAMYPIQVKGDGNCLPNTGSILTYGNDEHATEMRVRIILEATMNKEPYLNHEYLKNGIETTSKNLAKTYAMYSDQYIPGKGLDGSKVMDIYEKEMMNITKDKTYMGIWQIFALASVLQRPIFSIYPQLGNPQVRKDLHRVIYPRYTSTSDKIYIMWSTTRKDMNIQNWVPNHFVAVLSKDSERTTEIDKSLSKDRCNEAKSDTENIESGRKMNYVIDKETTNTKTEQNVCNNEVSKDENNNSLQTPLNSKDINPQSLVGQYVLVQYDKEPYPGLVIDCDDSEVYVSCMHRVGRKPETCSFYWPKAVRDVCWYNMDDILCIIPEPLRKGRNYCVDDGLWKKFLTINKP